MEPRSRHRPEGDVRTCADVLNSIGCKANEKIINSAVYWTTVGNQATKAQIGFADWFQDYPHPLDWFDVLLNGNRITQTHNNNYANFDDTAVNAKIEALKKEPTLTDAVNAQWASVDKMVDEQAPWAPFMNRQFTDFFNSDMDLSCYVEPRALPVRLRDDLHEVGRRRLNSRGRRERHPRRLSPGEGGRR